MNTNNTQALNWDRKWRIFYVPQGFSRINIQVFPGFSARLARGIKYIPYNASFIRSLNGTVA
jgi:hypothetical protein